MMFAFVSDNTTAIIASSVVGAIVLIAVLIIFQIVRYRYSEIHVFFLLLQ